MKSQNNKCIIDMYKKRFAYLNIILCFFLISCAIPINSLAQQEKYYKVKSSKGELNYVELKSSNELIVSNANCSKEMILKEYKVWGEIEPNFSGFRIDYADKIVKAFKNTFSQKKLDTLAKRNEIVCIRFEIDQNGNHLRIWFVFSNPTLVTPDEILLLNKNLKEMVVFTPIKKSNLKFFYGTDIDTNFKEILKGEISVLKKRKEYSEEIEKIQNEE